MKERKLAFLSGMAVVSLLTLAIAGFSKALGFSMPPANALAAAGIGGLIPVVVAMIDEFLKGNSRP